MAISNKRNVSARAAGAELGDAAQQLRLYNGFPEQPGFWMTLALHAALPALIFLRLKLGERMVTIFKLIPVAFLMVLWLLIVSAIVCWNDERAQIRSFWFGAGATIAFLAVGICKRLIRWWMSHRDEQLVTRSLGLSMAFQGVPKGIAERYLDPLFAIAVGVALCLPRVPVEFAALGSLAIVSGLALLGIEKYMHERRQLSRDAIMAGKAHDQETQQYMHGLGVHSGREERVATEVSTGLDPELTAAIKRRQQTHPTGSLVGPAIAPRREPGMHDLPPASDRADTTSAEASAEIPWERGDEGSSTHLAHPRRAGSTPALLTAGEPSTRVHPGVRNGALVVLACIGAVAFAYYQHRPRAMKAQQVAIARTEPARETALPAALLTPPQPAAVVSPSQERTQPMKLGPPTVEEVLTFKPPMADATRLPKPTFESMKRFLEKLGHSDDGDLAGAILADQSDPDNMYLIASLFESLGDHAGALAWYSKSADKGADGAVEARDRLRAALAQRK